MNKSNSFSASRSKKLNSNKELKLREKNKSTFAKEINQDLPEVSKPAKLRLSSINSSTNDEG